MHKGVGNFGLKGLNKSQTGRNRMIRAASSVSSMILHSMSHYYGSITPDHSGGMSD